MSYCLNPQCQKPQNPEGNKFCQTCGSKLLLGDRYLAIKPIGGSDSQTFQAVDDWHPAKRRCTIKQFRASAQTPPEIWRQEVARLEELGKHPQIPELLAHFEKDGRQYLVQEFIDGQNLTQQLIEEGEFSEDRIRQLLNDVLPVLQFLHAGQVIHRDIKPDNLIRRSLDNRLVLVGFGAAKRATQTALAKTGTLIGSAEYAAPEQLMGKAIFASDLYSLGVTCIHLLTQIHPFDLFDCMESQWIWRDYVGDRVTPQMGSILDKMLQSSLRNRYRSAEEIYKDLNPGKGLKIPSIPSRLTTPSTPNPPAKAIAKSSTSPLLLVEETTSTPPVPPLPSKSKMPSWRCDRTVSDPDSSAEITCVAFSPQSRTLASSSWDATIKLWDLENAEGGLQAPLHAIAGHANGVMAIAVSPDGQTLVSGSADCTVKIWRLWQLAPTDIRTGTQPALAHTLIGHTSMVTSVAISSDGKILATGSRDRTIKLWNLKTGELRHTFTEHSERILSLAISPNSQILASGSADNTIKIWKLETGKLLHTFTENGGAINAIAIAPDGKTLVSGSWDRTVKFWNLDNYQLLYTLSEHLLSVAAIAITRDGKTLVTGSHDATIKLWKLMDNGGIPVLMTTLSEHSRGINSVAFSPDGKTIVSASQDGSLKFWRFE